MQPVVFSPDEQRKWDGIESQARKEDERIQDMTDDDLTAVMESVLGPRKYEDRKKKAQQKSETESKGLPKKKKMVQKTGK